MFIWHSPRSPFKLLLLLRDRKGTTMIVRWVTKKIRKSVLRKFPLLAGKHIERLRDQNVLMMFDNQCKFHFAEKRGNSFSAFFATLPVILHSFKYCTFCLFYGRKKKDGLAKNVILEKGCFFANSTPFNCTSNPLPIRYFMVTARIEKNSCTSKAIPVNSTA